jgi:hypothetical protein
MTDDKQQPINRNHHHLSPMSSQHGENLVSSAMTANNRSTNIQIAIPLLETFNLMSEGGRNIVAENNNQLTLRN